MTTPEEPKASAQKPEDEKKPAATLDKKTSSSHDIKLSEVSPKAAAALKKSRADKRPAASTAKPPSPGQPTAKPGEAEKTIDKTRSSDAPAPRDPDFRSLKIVEECVEAYNDMVPTAIDLGIKKISSVKSFVDTKTGVLACERLHSIIKKARDPKTAASETSANAKQESTMAKKSKKAKGAKKAKGSAGRAKFDESAKVVWVGKGKENNGNPFREKSGKFARVEKLRGCSGQTVKTVLSKGVKIGTLRRCHGMKLVTVG